MKRRCSIFATQSEILGVLLVFCGAVQTTPATPIQLHPDNPRYFLWRGKAAVLITSTEHYGAVLNLDFDYKRYLNELHARGLNLTRIFSGAYREVPGSFGIKENTLAPKPGRFVSPWARSSTPGAGDGGNKFDLKTWDPAYFARLKDFVTEANNREIVVELVFFCTFYDEALWQASPMNARNNVNQIGKVERHQAYAIHEQELQAVQETVVRKIVTELKDFPNLYYEICNEPYERAGLTKEWNDRIVAAIAEIEAPFAAKHLIAQGINVRSGKVENPNPHVSVFNFHAASPEAARENYDLGKVIADDETGGKGIHDQAYRQEAWEFMFAGGAVFNHLDFSFTCAHPDGSFPLTNEPGGGGAGLRRQLQVLKEFMESLDFIRMKPDRGVVRTIRGPDEQKPPRCEILVEPGVAYAIYLVGKGPSELAISLPAGAYAAEWINPETGRINHKESFAANQGTKTFISPPYENDVVLRIKSNKRN